MTRLLAGRVSRLELKTPPPNPVDALPREVRRRLGFLLNERCVRRLEDAEWQELVAILQDMGGEAPKDRGPVGMSPEQQAHINEIAMFLPFYRRWATEKTWKDFTTTALMNLMRFIEGTDRVPREVRDCVIDLLSRRVCGNKLEPDQIAWLIDTLKDVDLGEEGPWLRDHLEGGREETC